eukprot:scaffold45357_cov22-Tisochrysis_lutea.AAC.1
MHGHPWPATGNLGSETCGCKDIPGLQQQIWKTRHVGARTSLACSGKCGKRDMRVHGPPWPAAAFKKEELRGLVSTVLPRGLDGWAQLSTVLTAGLAGLLHFTRGVACSLCAAAFKTERAGLEAAAEANITCPLGMSARCP